MSRFAVFVEYEVEASNKETAVQVVRDHLEDDYEHRIGLGETPLDYLVRVDRTMVLP